MPPNVIPVYPPQVETIRLAYHELGQRVRVAVQVHVGDFARLNEQYRSANQLLQSVNQHQQLFDNEEFITIITGIRSMMEAIDTVSVRSQDPPVVPPLHHTTLLQTGVRGRPKIHIDPSLLSASLELRGVTHLAPVFGCSPRTVRRRALEHGLVEAGPPVYSVYEDEETGQMVRWYSSSTPSMSELTDDQLDSLIAHVLEIFPSFGRRMITGHLRHQGHRVSRDRLRASYERIMGAPAGLTHRQIHRRVYRVAGPNSLWHHDGQHGLIRWRVVIHAFVDGYSRLVTGIQANDNNRASTVFDLFHSAIQAHGIPSRVRGDHGVENLEVAAFMEHNFGAERGSYIWGRSVHNIRIERLWADVTRGFGLKWYNFFMDLEFHGGLDPDDDTHMWLLHHLFLPSINQDTMEWAETWNAHSIRLDDERDRSPLDMFFFGVVQNGLRGPDGHIRPMVEDIQDLATYGVDWEDLDNRHLLGHHNQHNPQATENFPEGSNLPARLSTVEVPEFDCPLSAEEAAMFNNALPQLSEFGQRDMGSRRSLWIEALGILTHIMQLNQHQ